MKKFAILSMFLVLISCGKKAPKTPTMGLVVSTLNNPFFVSLRDGAIEKAKEIGYELITLDSQNDLAKELGNIEDLVTRKVSVILINPVDSDSSIKAATLAINAKIPLISLDRTLNNIKVASHIASDNVAGGVLAAEFIKSKVPDGSRLIELEGIPGTSAARDRGQGFNQGIQASGLSVIARQPADFDRAKALSVTETLLQVQQDIVAIFAHNDEMALGALRAVEAARKNIIIIGFDATPDAVASVKAKKLAATIAQQPDQIGSLGIVQGNKLAKGESVEENIPVALTIVSE
ncbi:MAG: ribose ABC transporter substrate-binding protein RbsB [Brevinema sp.]